MVELNGVQNKVLSLCHNGEYEKAWLYWKMMGYDYGIFLGEVSAKDFITGHSLAEAIGLDSGESQYHNSPWLKFLLNNELVFIPLQSLRHTITWEDIYQVGAVYGSDDFGTNPSGGDKLQDAKVMIGNYKFKVTLLKGAKGGEDPTSNDNGYDRYWTHGSEWNKLLYPIHTGVHHDGSNPCVGSVPFNQWASYSDEDLLVHNTHGDGSFSWTQETHGCRNTQSLFRGGFGVTYVYRLTSSYRNNHSGWRPSLRRKVF